MDAEAIINLFDSWWFSPKISSSPSNPETQNEEISENANNVCNNPLTIDITSRNNDSSLNSIYTDVGSSLSPNSVLFPSNLETTIFSSKRETETQPRKQRKLQSSRRRKIIKKVEKSRSLTELECEEVKGFTDLGFVFYEEDKYSSLVEIIPGLQRLGEEKNVQENNNIDESSSVMRPYLSEAWSVFEKEKIDNSLLKWRIPEMSTENDIKLSLKWWAHTVASVVQ